MIIVDNVPENFQLQPDNGIFITSWFDDVNDTALDELTPILIEIVNKQVSDVRAALRTLRDQMIEQISKGNNVNGITYSL
jgi:CTD small phosphatase-like protein 2